jgi:hypothetical protein
VVILAYSDKNYEYQVESLYKSLLLNGHGNLTFLYYTLGFESDLNYPNMVKKVWPLDPRIKRFNNYKPGICLDAIRSFGGDILFMDTDILVGKRFDPEFFVHDFDYPLCSVGNWDFPFYYEIDGQGNKIVYSESKLCDYLGVRGRTMNYVYSCLMSMNSKCEQFMLEAKSITENEYLNQFGPEYFPFSDETPINVILWKRGANQNYGRIFVNTGYADVVQHVENNDNIVSEDVFGNDLQKCENSANVKFYHGIKDKEELEKMMDYFYKTTKINESK